MVACALVVAGCGSKASPGGSDPDAPGGPSGPGTVTVTTITTPALIVFRDGPDAPWQVPTAAAVGRYEIDVHGPYTVQTVCTAGPDPDFIRVTELAQTTDDPHDVRMPCGVLPGANPSQVTGTMVQPGQVVVGASYDRASSARWQFGLDPGDGTFDLVATPEAGDRTTARVVIRRDQVIAGATTVTPSIDLAAEGVALASSAFTVTNLAVGEATDTSVSLQTRSTGAIPIYQGPIATARTVPDASLLPTDVQLAIVVGALPPHIRGVAHAVGRGGSTAFTLPPPFDAMRLAETNGQIVATWSNLPAFDTLHVQASGTPAGSQRFLVHQLTVSAAYARDAAITTATLDTDTPGYQPAWRIDFTRPYSREAGAATHGPEDTFSNRSEDLNQPVPSFGATSGSLHRARRAAPASPR